MSRPGPFLASLALHVGLAGALAGWSLLQDSAHRPVPVLAVAPESPAVSLEPDPPVERTPVEVEPSPEGRLFEARLIPEPVVDPPADFEAIDYAAALRESWRNVLPPLHAEPDPEPEEAEEPPVEEQAPPAAASQPAVAHPRVLVVAPRLRKGQVITEADYPRLARRRGIEGAVLVRVSVGADGRVRSAEVVRSSGHDILDEAALEAVRSWSFHPGLQEGHAVAGETEIRIRFQLRR